ncbi:MAG: tyrosine-type recombinase/integrase [Verrucomicrobiota bacterium]
MKKDVAAEKARDIYVSLVANGWEETLTKFRPDHFRKPESSTLGDYIEAVLQLSTANQRTIANYVMKTRTIVGEMIGARKTKAVANPKGDAFKQWREKVDSTLLVEITGPRLQKWKRRRMDAASDPVSKATSIRTLNSNLRNAKSLFSEKYREETKGKVALPEPIPFSDVKLERAPQKQFKSILKEKGGLAWIIAAAKNELRPQIPKYSECEDMNLAEYKKLRSEAESKHQQFKCFLLGLTCGMRRGEIDRLRWCDLDFERSTISIEVSELGDLKTFGSAGTIACPPEAMDVLRSYMEGSESEFVVESTRSPRPNAKYPAYRCQIHLRRLADWLRNKGISAAKPLHHLRGELASIIGETSGILAAAQQLRHASIQTTKTYYSDRLSYELPEEIGDAISRKGLKAVESEGDQEAV